MYHFNILARGENKTSRLPGYVLTNWLQSLRIAPPTNHPTHTNNITGRQYSAITAPHPSKGAPSAPGVPDTLRNKITLQAPSGAPSAAASSTPVSTHPLEARLLAWRATHDAMKMESLRRVYGMAEPIRRGMELKIVRDSNFTPMVLGGSRGNIHEDILALGGRDTEIGWEDVFKGESKKKNPPTSLQFISFLCF
jgi:proteasome maturation protein